VTVAATGAIKVLVIDDSNTIRRSAELFLKQAGYEVILAEDGFDALAKISDHQPQVIFVDIMMPRLDGYQTCALIKQHPLLKSTPVIMLSSKDGVFDRARGRLAGSDRYLTARETVQRLFLERQGNAHQEHPDRRRLPDRPPVPQRAAEEERLRGLHRRERRRGARQGEAEQARPGADGRGDAGTERLSGHPRAQQGYIVKPVKGDELLKKISALG
jgi:twitching motility two-component system response regulator PilG